MVLRNSLLWLLLIILLLPGSALAQGENIDWEPIAPGIDFHKFELPDPNNVYVARMDRSNPNVFLESSIAQGILQEGKETVSGMFSRYDQALNYWGGSADPPTWGMRNQVVVAVNGSYFDLSNGFPQGGQVQSGWYAKRYDKLGGWGGFAWTLDRSVFISECLNHLPENQFVTFPATGNVQRVSDVNDALNENELVIITPQHNIRTGTPSSVVDVLVEMNSPALIMPEPAYVSGIVRQIRVGEGNSWIPFNYLVLAANGTEAQTLLANVQVGSEVRISQEITSYEYDCTTSYPLSWTKTYASIQGAFFFLKDGQIREFNGDPGAARLNPRTALAFNDQYIFFVVVDGRDLYHSIGMSINQLALFVRDTLGATWGVAQDGGGSSTMVINGQVVNNTYCNLYTCMWDYGDTPPFDIKANFTEQTVIQSEGNVVVSPAGIERAVANGMLMVVAQPGEYSSTFKPGNLLRVIDDTDLRLGPGTNYASFTRVPKDTHGKIVDQVNGLEGVLAKSAYWWYVDFGDVSGWVPEETVTFVEGRLLRPALLHRR
jgi:hypothetical protein